MSSDLNGAWSEIYTKGKHVKSAPFEVNRKFLRQAVWRDISFEIVSVNRNNRNNRDN